MGRDEGEVRRLPYDTLPLRTYEAPGDRGSPVALPRAAPAVRARS